MVGRAGGNRELLFNGYRVSLLQGEKSSGDGWWCNVNIFNGTLKNS